MQFLPHPDIWIIVVQTWLAFVDCCF